MLAIMVNESPPNEKANKNPTDDVFKSQSVKVSGRPLRRRYEVEPASVQKQKHAEELAELRQQSEVLKRKGDIDHEEKQRQFGIIYSRRKRLREKQKVLELEEECERIRASNQHLKVDNSRLEAILSVVLTQVSQLDQAQVATSLIGDQPSSFAHGIRNHRFPSLPLPHLCPPFEPSMPAQRDGNSLHQPMTSLGPMSTIAAPATSMQTASGTENITGASTIPSLLAAIASQAQADHQWEHQQILTQMLDRSTGNPSYLSELASLHGFRSSLDAESFEPHFDHHSTTWGRQANYLSACAPDGWGHAPIITLNAQIQSPNPFFGEFGGQHDNSRPADLAFAEANQGLSFLAFHQQQEQAAQFSHDEPVTHINDEAASFSRDQTLNVKPRNETAPRHEAYRDRNEWSGSMQQK